RRDTRSGRGLTAAAMRFLPLGVDDAVGCILGHNIVDGEGRRRLRKGKVLESADADTLRGLGREVVYVAELAPDDVREDEAADRVAAASCGRNLRLTAARTGRVNAYATHLGLLRMDAERLLALNLIDGLHMATRQPNAVVRPDMIAATLKVVPYAVAASAIADAAELGDALWVDPLAPRRVGLVLTGSPGSRGRVVKSFTRALGARLEDLGSSVAETRYVSVDDDDGEMRLSGEIERLGRSVDVLILAGETAVVDRADIAPRAVERAGGEVVCYGAPVDPGNLLLLARLGPVPVLGAPGCARSPMANIVDLVLPRLLAGDALDREDVARLGVGGLLDDVPERPMPRRRAG
ncbi:MAG: molybdopterin-binding protein, partial [Acidobacteriota bacterium]